MFGQVQQKVGYKAQLDVLVQTMNNASELSRMKRDSASKLSLASSRRSCYPHYKATALYSKEWSDSTHEDPEGAPYQGEVAYVERRAKNANKNKSTVRGYHNNNDGACKFDT